MNALARCNHLEVRQSPVEGFGVFATEDIPKDTVLEEVPFILFPRYHNIAGGIYHFLQNSGFTADRERYLENLRSNLKFKEPEKYFFKWHPQNPLDGNAMYTVLPLGFGPIYNSSNTNNNAEWQILEKTFIFRAERDIKKGEEIRTFYGYFLGQDGVTFECDAVFNMAIDTNPSSGVHELKKLNFSNMQSFAASRQNPSTVKIQQLFTKAKDSALVIKVMMALQADGSQAAQFMVPANISLSQLYAKISEMHSMPVPVVGFVFTYVDKETDKAVEANVLIRK